MKHLIVLLLINSNCYAQIESNSISAHIGYSLSNALWTNGTNLKPTYNAGIEFRHQLKESGFHLQTGIRWNEYGFKSELTEYIWYPDGAVTNHIDFESTSFFITLPLITTYKFKKTVPGLTLSTGPQLSYYLFNKSKFNNNINFSVLNYKPLFNLGFYVATGYEYSLNYKWIIGGEAYSNINLPLYSNFGSEGNYNFGISLTGRYIFKKKP